MASSRILNQAVKLYTALETLFNDKTSICQWHLDYFPLVTCDDTTEWVMDVATQTADVQVGGDFGTEGLEGTQTSISAGKLVDSGADFDGSIGVGTPIATTFMWARNTSTDVTSRITSVDSATTITLVDDIFSAGGQNYEISNYNLSGNFAIGTDELVKTTGAVATMKQTNILVDNNLYKYEIDITSFTSTLDGDQLRFYIGGTLVLTLDETDDPSGTVTLYGYASGNDETAIMIDSDANIAATFSDLVVTQLNNPMFFVVNCDDNTVAYSSLYTDIISSATSSQIKMSFDWGNLQDGYGCTGCYHIRIIDDVGVPENVSLDRIIDGDFPNLTNWNAGSGWTAGIGVAIMSSAGGAGDLTQTTLAYNFSKSLSYDVTFTVAGYSAGDFDVKLYNGAAEVANLGNISAAGTYTLSSGVLTANCDSISFEANSVGNQGYQLSTLTALLDVVDSGYDFRTDCYQLKASHDCTVKLSGTNLDNAFGIDFVGLSYNPVVRISAELMNPKYDGDKENEEDSAGVSKTLYFKSEKKRNLFIWQQPEWMHDFLRLLIGYDTFLVDDVNYISQDASYSTEGERLAGKLPDLSNANSELRLKTDLNENKYC